MFFDYFWRFFVILNHFIKPERSWAGSEPSRSGAAAEPSQAAAEPSRAEAGASGAAHGKVEPSRPAQISSTIGHRAFRQVSFGALEFFSAHACPRQLDTGLKSGARASRATVGEYELRGARREFVFDFCAGLRGARRDVFFEFCEVCLLRTHFGSN